MSRPDASVRQKTFPYTWEQAIEILRADPEHRELIESAYLTSDIIENARRFAASDEFATTLTLVRRYAPRAARVLDVPGGNGIATYAFATNGYSLSTVEPDGSDSVGRGAIQRVLDHHGLASNVVAAFGEALPFGDRSFDVVYVRQGLHHARDLGKMVSEYARVLDAGGLLVACREHVVDNYGESLKRFLDSQVDHQLYGGENAFLLKDYQRAISDAGLDLLETIPPYDSPINLHPNTPAVLEEKIVRTAVGQLMTKVLPEAAVRRIGFWALKHSRRPGRLYSFVALKP